MGNRKKNSRNRVKDNKNPASNKSKKTAPSTSNRTEGKIDEKNITKGTESVQKSYEIFQAASNFQQGVAEGIENAEGRNTSKENITVAVQILFSKLLPMTDENIKEMLDTLVESKTKTAGGNISSSQEGLSSPDDGRGDRNFLKSKDPELFEKLMNCNILKVKLMHFQKILDILKSSRTLSIYKLFQLMGETVFDVAFDMYNEFEMTIAKRKNDCNEITAYLGQIDVENVGTNDHDGFVYGNLEAMYSKQILALEDEIKKGGDIYFVYSQETELSRHNEENNDEALMKIIDCSDKILGHELDDQAQKIRGNELEEIVKAEQLDLISPEKDESAAVTTTGILEETKGAISDEDGRISNVVKLAELNKPGEEVIELGKKSDIQFEFFSNGNKKISVDGRYTYMSENQCITFKYKDECVQVSFAGKKVFVSTPNSEYEIFVQNSIPNYLRDEATQTDSL